MTGPPAASPALGQQWIVATVTLWISVVAIPLEQGLFPQAAGGLTPVSIAAAVATILLPPVALPVYLIPAYRIRGALAALLYLFLVATSIVLGLGAAQLVFRWQDNS